MDIAVVIREVSWTDDNPSGMFSMRLEVLADRNDMESMKELIDSAKEGIPLRLILEKSVHLEQTNYEEMKKEFEKSPRMLKLNKKEIEYGKI